MAATKTQTTVHFYSRHAALRIVRRDAQERILANGAVATVAPEVVYEFQMGNLHLRPGQDRMADKLDPSTGEFVEQDAIEYLRSHPEFEVRFFENVPVAPDPAPLYEAIIDATIAGDVDTLIALGEEEFGSWNREDVMSRIKAALDKLDPPKEED